MKFVIYQSNVRGLLGFSKEFNEKDFGKPIKVSDPDFGYKLVLQSELPNAPCKIIDALHMIYRMMNEPSGPLRDKMNAQRVRSLSMGDIVYVYDSYLGNQYYYVDEGSDFTLTEY